MKTIAIIVFMFCLGCATTGNQTIMNSNFMSSLQIGVTTKDEARALLGEPKESEMPQLLANGEVTCEAWRYMGSETSVNAAAFIPLVDIAAGKQTSVVRVVDLWFDKKGVLYDIKVQSEMSERMMPIGTLAVGVAGAGVVAGAAASRPYYGYPGYGYRPGKTIVNSIPTGGGGYMTTIKHYK